MEWVLFLCFMISFITTLLIVPKWIKKAKAVGLVGTDMNKFHKPKVAEAGGITVIIGTVFGILFYIFIKTFYFSSPEGLVEIFAVIATILMAGFIGFVDDILGWKTGMRQRHKVLSTLPIAIPLAVVNAGDSVMALPFLGAVDFGVIFPLVIIPAGIIGATNGFNMLAGYNGLESGMGIIILSTLGIIMWLSSSSWVTMLSLSMVFALVAFLWYNKSPAKVFPGDSLTYPVGATIACIAILGNTERIALILFIPYIFFEALGFMKFLIEKHRDSRVELPEAFATNVYPDGSLEYKDKKIYGFEPIGYKIAKMFKQKVYENDVVMSIWGVEMLIAVIALWLWLQHII